ncbi:MAG TPA: glycogen synthase GlgA [Clostridia bacterium]|nr:glycogen synthase GlgA [Clostridia bacterium]
MKNIIFAAGEAAPFAKTGGLGDVVGSLPKAIKELGGDVRVIMPKYGGIPQGFMDGYRHIVDFHVDVGWRSQFCALGEVEYQGIHYYFIDNEYYFKRDCLYGYDDDAERFAFFSRAVLESLPRIEGFKPDIIHCHDWHTALLPMMIREHYGEDPFYQGVKTVLTIHNLRHQGIFPLSILDDLLGITEGSEAANNLEFNGAANYFKGGLVYADSITTVSPTYASEILTPYFGEGLDGILRMQRDKLRGILNGIDYRIYNPLRDPNLFVKYRSSLGKKADNKAALQSLVGLPEDRDVPLLGLVTRLDSQKGLDLLNHIMDELMDEELQMVVLGTGDRAYEDAFYYFASKYPAKLAVKILFDSSLAHKIYASADMLLMPSQFEPCGLAQMIAMRYNTVPIVRETGGLKDTVVPYNEETGEGNGFSFANYNAHELLFTIRRALKVYREDKAAWKGITESGRKMDFSWNASARSYMELYEELAE